MDTSTPTLMGLPAECRIRIFEYVFEDEEEIGRIDLILEEAIQIGIPHPLLRVSKKVNAETSLVNKAVLYVVDEYEDKNFELQPAKLRQSITAIRVESYDGFRARRINKRVFPRLRQVDIRTAAYIPPEPEAVMESLIKDGPGPLTNLCINVKELSRSEAELKKLTERLTSEITQGQHNGSIMGMIADDPTFWDEHDKPMKPLKSSKKPDINILCYTPLTIPVIQIAGDISIGWELLCHSCLDFSVVWNFHTQNVYRIEKIPIEEPPVEQTRLDSIDAILASQSDDTAPAGVGA